MPWYRTITREQWRTLLAAMVGWMLDSMDFVLYLMAIKAIREEFLDFLLTLPAAFTHGLPAFFESQATY